MVDNSEIQYSKISDSQPILLSYNPQDLFHTPFGTLVAYIFIGCLVIYTLYQGLTDFKKPGAVAEFKNDSFRLLFSVLKAVSITLGVFIALFSLILGIFILNTDLNVGLFFIFLALVVCGLFFYWYFKYHRKKIKHDY
jgi:heme/copper-type cytochrome/quinol oxidase subunit 2